MSVLERRELLGVEKGIEKRRQERDIEIAKNLLREWAEMTLVIRATGLSKTEVENLKEELTK